MDLILNFYCTFLFKLVNQVFFSIFANLFQALGQIIPEFKLVNIESHLNGGHFTKQLMDAFTVLK